MNNKYEYSKLIATISMLLFVITLILGFIFMFYVLLNDDTTLYDVTVFVTSISITGGVYATTVKHYYQKSGLQNCIQIKRSFYRDAMDIRVEYDKQILELQKQYNVQKSSIDEIESSSPFVYMSEDALSKITGKIEDVENDNSTDSE